MSIRGRLPWWFRLAAKLALARLPVPYGVWRRLGMFRHGDMADPGHAVDTFKKYLDIGRRYAGPRGNFVSLELGPGDSLLGGVAALAAGAEKAWLVDAGKYAEWDAKAAMRTFDTARERYGWAGGGGIPAGSPPVEDLPGTRILYLTGGTDSLREIPAGSVDFVWSNVVLEHVPLDELDRLLAELRRVSRADAVGVHGVDFRDHLGGGLNNLRFSARLWEGALFRRSGFYTNRVRFREMTERMERAGFTVTVHARESWDVLPLARDSMADPYRNLDEEDLLVAEAVFVLRPC